MHQMKLIIISSFLFLSTVTATPFRLSTYPTNPTAQACRHVENPRLCDPDAILTDGIKIELADDLTTRNVTLKNGTDVVVQYGVAVMKKMDLDTSDGSDAMDMFDDAPEKAAEVFGRHIHDTWGIGTVDGTGVLIFLSIKDRSVYISRGAAVDTILRDRRLDVIVEHMKPFLRKGDYDGAIQIAVAELDTYLQAGIQLSATERLQDWFEQSIFFIVLGIVGWLIRKDFVARRDYTRVSSQLSALDQARAEALQGTFKTTSCPICLEDFKTKESDAGSEEDTEPQLVGSDGLQIKLLRCGHVFDETCWQEWINNGNHRKIDKCPICQQDVGPSPRDGDPLSIPRGGHNASETMTRANDESENAARADLALRRYTQDRNFRLMRMAARYPQYIHRSQLQRWTQVSYNGSMAQDSNVARQAATQARMNDSIGFGGGSSSGGRGGRW